ncbi:DC1 [Arabidopsis thaliana x Arabidopsis arenosa]|uniref:DC1 n=1 Tax=Arabidopsis thaliana x Arabidopsis arenosa TaxID=1240361 RepID=A0A8T2C831_9BRAS|nr:DC1 [Arabidopsis thaliana x Arabidopsis arenosa]
MDSPELKLISLATQLISLNNSTDLELVSCTIIQIISLVSSMDLDSQPKPETKLMSLIAQTISLFNSMDLDSQPEPLRKLISLITHEVSLQNSIDSDSEPTKPNSEFMSFYSETFKLEPRPELISMITQIFLFIDSDSDSEMESKLISVISQMISIGSFGETDGELDESQKMSKTKSVILLISQLISLVRSLDLDSQPEPESELISLIKQVISVGNSISDSEPEWELISLVTHMTNIISSIDLEPEPPAQLLSLMAHIYINFYSMDWDSELLTLLSQIFALVSSTDLASESESEWGPDQLILLSPQFKVQLVQGKFHVTGKVERKSKEKGICHPGSRVKLYLARGEDASHFRCKDCNGEDHEECEKTPVEVKHPLHPKHSLQLVSQKSSRIQTRKCFCCDEDLEKIFYYCSDCDYAMNIVCAEKPPVLYIDHPNWHNHTLALFPRQAFLTCNVCALADSSSPIYMCPPCDFVVHLRCINLPRVIRISRHPHRISFTPLFDQQDRSCGVCREKIDSDYGGYSCIKDDCSYGAHSRCATQRNVWDGIELEGVLEEIEEEVEPFVTISDGIIQHFSHQQHHLRLDENKDRDYDDSMLCDACITPIYFGNLYSCMQCSFILHEECANLSRKIHHPIHPHMLSLAGGYNDVRKYEDKCSACPWSCIAGFFYVCVKEGCYFKLHVQCATISEPLVHGSHMDPLFLTSKPGEQRGCSVCKDSRLECTNETFNCIKCDFALCFGCATLPQNVRYKHDNHILTLSYGKETNTMTYWCEVCEGKMSDWEGLIHEARFIVYLQGWKKAICCAQQSYVSTILHRL